MVETIFSELPKATNTFSIIPDFGTNNVDNEIIFEMLLDIYMESIIDVERLIDMLITKESIEKKDIKSIDLSKINIDILGIVEPWFRSFGFGINIHEYSHEDYIELKNELKLYCRVMFRDCNDDRGYFVMNNINSLYHFVKFANYKTSDKLSDICFVINNANSHFIISFYQL